MAGFDYGRAIGDSFRLIFNLLFLVIWMFALLSISYARKKGIELSKEYKA